MKKIVGKNFCGAHTWQLSYLWDTRVPCRAHASKQAVGILPAETQHALVKQPLLTKHGPQTERDTQEERGRTLSRREVWFHWVETCWISAWLHRPDRAALKHTCGHFHWNSAFTTPSSISTSLSAVSRPDSLLLWLLTLLTHSCGGERCRWKAEVIREALSVTLWLREALSFSPITPPLVPFVLSFFSPVSLSAANSEGKASCPHVSCLPRRVERRIVKIQPCLRDTHTHFLSRCICSTIR